MNFRFKIFHPPTRGYIFNFKTNGLATGICHLGLYVGSDPAVHIVQFQIR
jgi:hypothetical protein